MTAVNFDSDHGDAARRKSLYNGQLFVYSPYQSTRALCELARELAEAAFAPHHPQEAQNLLAVDEYVSILGRLKPQFIHHPESKRRIQAVLQELECDLDKTYFDLPRLRTSTHSNYLTSGMGYAFKPHRDTWYSTPLSQINWWLPVYEIESDNAMAFHLSYWDRPLKNSSSDFNYQEWNRVGRALAPSQVGRDTRKQSEALEPIELDPQLRVICKSNGLLVFSAAHLHSTVPNTSSRTRFSIDFRTVHLDDLSTNAGAPNLDSAAAGTTIRDYVRGSDLAHMPESILCLYEDRAPIGDERSPQFRAT